MLLPPEREGASLSTVFTKQHLLDAWMEAYAAEETKNGGFDMLMFNKTSRRFGEADAPPIVTHVRIFRGREVETFEIGLPDTSTDTLQHVVDLCEGQWGTVLTIDQGAKNLHTGLATEADLL
jgi:hypothetical protein